MTDLVSTQGTGRSGRAIAEAVYGDRFDAIAAYEQILATKAIEWGIIGPREADKLWERHILNSAALSSLIGQGLTVMDVGSGAGLPGIPLAILRPDLDVILLEPLLRRHTFLEETVADLGLSAVEVRRGRAEDQDDVVDVVACRAVAPLDRVVRWTTPLFYPDGILLAMKGSSAGEELAGAAALLRSARLSGEVVSVRAHPEGEATSVVRISK